jgi:hypothetical protein
VISRYESADSEDSLTEPASSRRRWWNVHFACDVRCGTVERAKTFVFLPQGDSYAPDFLILMILLTETSPAFAQGNMGSRKSSRPADAMRIAFANDNWTMMARFNSACSRIERSSVRAAKRCLQAMVCEAWFYLPSIPGLIQDRWMTHTEP